MEVWYHIMVDTVPSSLLEESPYNLGSKFWCLCLSDGYRIHTKPYRGEDTNLLETELGQGSDVVLGMSE